MPQGTPTQPGRAGWTSNRRQIHLLEMGAWLSRRVGSEPYYASYEKAFERLEKESAKLLVR